MNLESVGKKIDDIDVTISSRIIELFSAGLYSSPNKAFEELICNSYDAFASKVAVYSPDDPTVSNAYIWVCDNGEGLDASELKQLWKIGESLKRKDKERDKKRLQIGQFGIGKLSTYILARKLTYISKKNEQYILATMDYNLINNDVNGIKIDEREISEDEAKLIADEYIKSELLNFKLFGEKASKTWTISLMTELKPKASEIKPGRLKWLLSTALPLNPGFQLKFNGAEVESSKVKTPIMKKWIIGKEDQTLDKIDGAVSRVEKDADGKEKYYVDLLNIRGINGEFILYEDSLVEGKSSNLGRSHGIFLSIRGRLINLDDPLLGMEAFSHGAFNRTRIIINADELDDNLTSTREAVRDSLPFTQLKEYIKKKFNNEVRKYYFEQERKLDQEKSVSYRMAQTAYTTSKRPVYNFIKQFYEEKIINPLLIEKPALDKKEQLLGLYERDLETGEQVIEKIEYDYKQIEESIAKLNLLTKTLWINMLEIYMNVKSIGTRKNVIDKIPFHYDKQPQTLREFLSVTVTIGVNDYIERSRQGACVLTEENIHDMADVGKIAFGIIYGNKEPDVEEAVAVAVQAFEDGLYRVFVNGEEAEQLDERLALQDGDEVSLIRLTMLAGRIW